MVLAGYRGMGWWGGMEERCRDGGGRMVRWRSRSNWRSVGDDQVCGHGWAACGLWPRLSAERWAECRSRMALLAGWAYGAGPGDDVLAPLQHAHPSSLHRPPVDTLYTTHSDIPVRALRSALAACCALLCSVSGIESQRDMVLLAVTPVMQLCTSPQPFASIYRPAPAPGTRICHPILAVLAAQTQESAVHRFARPSPLAGWARTAPPNRKQGAYCAFRCVVPPRRVRRQQLALSGAPRGPSVPGGLQHSMPASLAVQSHAPVSPQPASGTSWALGQAWAAGGERLPALSSAQISS